MGLREVLKHLKAGNLKMVILATDMEKVEEENGIDNFMIELMALCMKLKVPYVFSVNRFKLGCLAKVRGQKVSAVGVLNFQGANEEFRDLCELTDELRDKFYDLLTVSFSVADLQMLRKENRFFNWDHSRLRELFAN